MREEWHVEDAQEAHEAKEVQEVEEVEEKNGRVGAFFDLDGTLVPKPSLEERFFRMLRYRRLIGARNYFFWIAEAVRLAPRGINQIMHANKMYLRGVRVDGGRTDTLVCPGLKNAAEESGEGSREKIGEGVGKQAGEKKRQAGMPVPLYPEAVERMAWHVERGHLIAVVSGTLEPLAKETARALEAELGARGLACAIGVCATRLEERNEKWTGRIAGEAVFGEAKARAIRRIAAADGLDLERCFAYGDSASDKWMLETVGKPAAVNPSNDLARIARRNEWAVLRWEMGKRLTQRARSSQRTQREDKGEHESRGMRAKAEFRT